MTFKNFADFNKFAPITGMSFLIFNICYFVMLFTVFRPTFFEFALFMIVDLIALLIVNEIFNRVFLKKWPVYIPFFCNKKVSDHEFREELERISPELILKSLYDFPKNRFRNVFWGCSFKIMPAMLVIGFFWHWESTLLRHILSIIAFEVPIITFFLLLCSIEFHRHAYEVVEYLAKFEPWRSNLSRVIPNIPKRLLLFQEKIAIALMALGCLGFQLLIVSQTNDQNRVESIMVTILSITCNFMLIARALHVRSNYLNRELGNVLERFAQIFPQKDFELIPIHGEPLIASFESTYNSLVTRIKAFETELKILVFKKAEESRLQALGEIAAMVAHDMASPLQTIDFCTKRFREDATMIQNPTYIKAMDIAMASILTLLDSLRTYLRTGQSAPHGSCIRDIHQQLMWLLEARAKSDFFRYNIDISDAVLDLPFLINKQDLLQILQNIMSNSLDNFATHANTNGRIHVSLNSIQPQTATMLIEDNGSGISSEDFELATGFAVTSSGKICDKPSLGLRLVRRVVERYQGFLTAIDSETPGMHLVLTLPLASQSNEEPIPFSNSPHTVNRSDHQIQPTDIQ